MTLHTEEERQLWKDAVLRAVKCIKQKAQPYATIADMLVEAYRERLPKPDDSPAQENKPEQETPTIKMEWRDARPEDVGKGLWCRVKDYDTHPWREYDVITNQKRILKEYNNDNSYSWLTDAGTSWRFCQVYAPVERPAPVEPTPADEGWRPFEECPDGVIVEFGSSIGNGREIAYMHRVIGQKVGGKLVLMTQGCGRTPSDAYTITHFRPIGGAK